MSVGAAILGAICQDGNFGDKLPGTHRCPICFQWLCAHHYALHINAGEHSELLHHSDCCGTSGRIDPAKALAL